MSVEEALARGSVTFMGLELLVAPHVLVPRPETELLARTALELVASAGLREPRIIDVCCGAGNVACAVAQGLPGARMWASDLTPDAVALARRNVEKLGLAPRVSVVEGDLFAGLAHLGLEGTVDLVTCNPPYISQARLAGASADLLASEPREAFDGGPYGLTIHGRVVKEVLAFLKPGGHLAFEIGLGQARQVTILFERAKVYEEVRVVPDAAGEGRVALARRRTE